MYINIPYDKANTLVNKFAGVNPAIQMEKIGDRAVKINVQMDIDVPIVGSVKKGIDLSVSVIEVTGNDIKLQYVCSAAMQLLVSTTLKAIPQLDQNGIADFMEDNIIILHLDRIERIQSALENFKATDILFTHDSIRLMFDVR